MDHIGGIGKFGAVMHQCKPPLFQIGSHETFPKIASAPRRQDIFKRQRAIAYGHHGVGLIRERGMITGSKISTPIHLDMILRSPRAIFGHLSYEHQLPLQEQFRAAAGQRSVELRGGKDGSRMWSSWCSLEP